MPGVTNIESQPKEPLWRVSTFNETGDWRWRLYRRELPTPVVQLQVGSPYPFWTLKLQLGGGNGEQILAFIGAMGRGYSLHLTQLPLPQWLTHKQIKTSTRGLSLPKSQWWWMPRERQFGICLYIEDANAVISADHHLQFLIWDGDGWSSRQPWWQSFSLHPLNWLFGKLKYSEENLMIAQQSMVINGVDQNLGVKIYRATWKRPRWLGKLVVHRASVDINPGIPRRDRPGRNWESMSFPLQDGGLPDDPVGVAIAHVIAEAEAIR